MGMNKGIGGHHSSHSGKDEWLTPPEIFKSLGKFDLDPCSPILRPWETAKKHYTVEDDGLSIPWEGRVWCNPPYGRETGKWLSRCASHRNAIALIFARTETADWVNQVWRKADGILFLFGRLYFHHVDGTKASCNAGGPSALIAYGKTNVEALRNSGLNGKLITL